MANIILLHSLLFNTVKVLDISLAKIYPYLLYTFQNKTMRVTAVAQRLGVPAEFLEDLGSILSTQVSGTKLPITLVPQGPIISPGLCEHLHICGMPTNILMVHKSNK